jgi:hypothetical protein
MRARKRCRFLASAVLVAVALASAAGCEESIVDRILDPSPIDSAGDVGRYCTMAQATGALLVAYMYRDDVELTYDRLKLARSTDNGLTWATRFLDWDVQSDVGQYISIGASGSRVAVAYRVAGATDLRCAVSTDAGATWHRYPVTGAGADCRYTSTAIGPTGTIHVAYYELGGADLKLAWSDDDGATWSFSTIDSSISTAGWQYVSIAVNGTNVYAAYYYSANADLRFAWAPAPNGVFTPKPIECTGSSVGQYCSLRYSPQSDTLWVAYHDAAVTGGLKVARWKLKEAGWVCMGVIDDEGVTGLYASLTVSGASGQNLAIACYQDWMYRLKVARSADGGDTWATEVVGGEGMGQWASIVATGPDNYAVSCYDSLAGDLRLASWDGADWTIR